jgi:Protein of unknown function (DUF2934)
MLNTSQTGQSQNKGNVNFQRTGNGDGSKNASGVTARTETPQPSEPRGRKATAVTSAANPAATHSIALTHDEIAARAQQIYEKKGRPQGRDTENWLEAEAELRRERGAKAGKR